MAAAMGDDVPHTKTWYKDGTYGDSQIWTLQPDGKAKYHYNRGHDVFGEKDNYKEGIFTLRSVDDATAEAVITWQREKNTGAQEPRPGHQLDEWYDLNDDDDGSTFLMKDIKKSDLVE